MHALIESTAKGRNIWSQQQWATLIAGAKQKPPEYSVKQIELKEILDFKSLAPMMIWDKLRLSELREMKIYSKDPLNVRVRYDFTQTYFNLFPIMGKGYDINNVKDYVLNPAATDIFKIEKNKLSHLKTILDRYIVDEEAKEQMEKIIDDQAKFMEVKKM